VAPEVVAAGGTYQAIAMDEAHTCGKLVTVPAWTAHPARMAQLLTVLGTRIEL
jgi:protease I